MLPRLMVLPFLLWTLLTGEHAQAAPDELAAAIPIGSPYYRPVTLGADAPPPLAAQPNILFVNFDGGEVTVTVTDEQGNQSSDVVAFTVLGPPTPTTAGEESSGGAESSGETPRTSGEPGETGEPETTTATTGANTSPAGETLSTDASDSEAMTDGDDGCGCRHGDPTALALLAPLALGVRRRRRV